MEGRFEGRLRGDCNILRGREEFVLRWACDEGEGSQLLSRRVGGSGLGRRAGEEQRMRRSSAVRGCIRNL